MNYDAFLLAYKNNTKTYFPSIKSQTIVIKFIYIYFVNTYIWLLLYLLTSWKNISKSVWKKTIIIKNSELVYISVEHKMSKYSVCVCVCIFRLNFYYFAFEVNLSWIVYKLEIKVNHEFDCKYSAVSWET